MVGIAAGVGVDAEDEPEVFAAGHHQMGRLEIVEYGGHHAGDAALASGQKSGEVYHQGAALAAIVEKAGHAGAGAGVDGVVSAVYDDAAVVDTRPHDIEVGRPVVGIAGDVDAAARGVGIQLQGGAALGEAVDTPGVGTGLGEKLHHTVAGGVGAGLRHHLHCQPQAGEHGGGVDDAAAGDGAHRALAFKYYVEAALAYADNLSHCVCQSGMGGMAEAQERSPRAAVPR